MQLIMQMYKIIANKQFPTLITPCFSNLMNYLPIDGNDFFLTRTHWTDSVAQT